MVWSGHFCVREHDLLWPLLCPGTWSAMVTSVTAMESSNRDSVISSTAPFVNSLVSPAEETPDVYIQEVLTFLLEAFIAYVHVWSDRLSSSFWSSHHRSL